MKKLFVIALAAVLVVMFSLPATAKVMHKFNGYWRTRWYSYDNLDYRDNSKSLTAIDTRTRIKYTAQIHDNLKLVNYFEMDAIWGENPKDSSYGDRGADAVAIEVKNTYADFNFANLDFQIGTQNFRDATGGFVYNDDFTGMKANYRGDNYVLGFRWMRNYEGYQNDNGSDFDTFDLIFNYKAGNIRIAPFITYQFSNDGSTFPSEGAATDEYEVYFLGARFDMKFGNYTWWVNAIYEGGDANDAQDVEAYVVDSQINGKWGQWGAFARFMYVSGDDDTTSGDIEGWTTPTGKEQSISNYAELWGDGKFDVTKPDGSTGKDVTNIMTFGLGGSYKLNKEWMFKASWWYLAYAEDGLDSQSGNPDDEIGNEFDFWATWSFMKAMKAHFIFSYLIAGDALDNAASPESSEDPWELGMQLELKF